MHRRNRYLSLFTTLAAFFFFPIDLPATHQRAAEITYRHLSGLTYEITLISYTFTPSPANAYRDYLMIDWGDGTMSEIPRVEVTYLPNDITFNRYIGQHTFPGPASYTISCEDPNRNGGIMNIPNSINTPLFIYSELVISPFMGGYNNSPVLLLPPIDNGCVNQPYYHNPGAYDADHDSLSYRLMPCRGAQGKIIPGYTYPPATTLFELNPVTGDLTWDSPPQQGEYNIAILIEEWRNGVKIGSVLRDMQIIIIACDNRGPVIDSVADTCVEANKVLRFKVKAWDPDSNTVTLTGTGGPLIMTTNYATLDPNPAIGQGHTETLFRWATVCDHVIRTPYTVFFKAKDNGSPVALATIKSMKILVVGPAPENLTATPMGNTIILNWDDYTCLNAKGYYIFRKADSTGFIPGYCQTGVPAYLGYAHIGTITNITTTTFLDDNGGQGLNRGIRYCYLIVAFYNDGAESYASNETCAELKKDVAVITNVSINTTNETTGSIYVAWSKPTEIDTIQAPGPYKYILLRSRSDIPGLLVPVDSTDNLNDTLYNDTLLNTKMFRYLYRVDLYNNTPGNRFLIGTSQIATSIFITISPSNRRLKIRWNNDVPWTNFSFVIYRQNPLSLMYDSIGTSISPAFDDIGLVNYETYCYKVKTIGKYSASGLIEPIINWSQENCGQPYDNEPPCPPKLNVTSLCNEMINHLSWGLPSDTCPIDIAIYCIYYSNFQADPLALIDSVTNPLDTTYDHHPGNSVSGCYAVSAKDSTGNKSEWSNIVCIDYTACPDYELPNIFTPNGDSINDIMIPIKNYSVESVEMTIYNRWGKEVFRTTDPRINWDGRDKTTNQPCSDGVYFYVCDAYVITLRGLEKQSFHGSVTILR
jgi:gliding motility-associated-like protein